MYLRSDCSITTTSESPRTLAMARASFHVEASSRTVTGAVSAMSLMVAEAVTA